MNLCINDMLYSFSYALDCVEHDLLGVTTYHGPRVAAMSVAMGKQMGMTEEELLDLAGCAILHDCALTEYIQAEREKGVDILADPAAFAPAFHCKAGENNVKEFPFESQVAGIILYHHENADGSGPFGRTAAQTPMKAQIIHIADQLDTESNFSFFTREKQDILEGIMRKRGKSQFSRECTELFLESCRPQFLTTLHRERATVVLRESLPQIYKDYSGEEILRICSVMAKIIDYKSEFTRRHSLGIAKKAMAMGKFYGLGEETEIKLYLAGALHDIGKLAVDRDILEKPARLTAQEYSHIQNHAYKTFEILNHIDGLGEVVNWAALHHERLDGKGYPFGKTGDQLNKMERLMACLDIYQALTEERPYKAGMEHQRAMDILRDMADKNQIDGDIVEDIGRACEGGSFQDMDV